jgi:hypothetical protein
VSVVLEPVALITLETAAAGSAVEAVLGTLGAAALVNVVLALAGDAASRVTGHALLNAAVAALPVEEEGAEGTGAGLRQAVIVLRIEALDLYAGEVTAVSEIVGGVTLCADIGTIAAALLAVTDVAGVGQDAAIATGRVGQVVAVLTGEAVDRVAAQQAVADLAAAGHAVAVGGQEVEVLALGAYDCAVGGEGARLAVGLGGGAGLAGGGGGVEVEAGGAAEDAGGGCGGEGVGAVALGAGGGTAAGGAVEDAAIEDAGGAAVSGDVAVLAVAAETARQTRQAVVDVAHHVARIAVSRHRVPRLAGRTGRVR